MAILHGSEAWCMKKNEMRIIHRTAIHGDSNVWSIAQRQKNVYRFDVHVGFE